MTFKREFLAALTAGRGYESLLELAHDHQAQGLQPRQLYDLLEEIWLELGFSGREDDGDDLQNNLEAVMEKVWYECPA